MLAARSASVEATAGDEFIDMLVALIVAHIDGHAAIAGDAPWWRTRSSCGRELCASSALT